MLHKVTVANRMNIFFLNPRTIAGWNLQVTPDSPKDLSFTTEPDGSLVVSWTAVAKPKDAMVFYNVSVQTMDDYSLLGLFVRQNYAKSKLN